MTYNRITMVGSVLQDDSLIPIIEKVYQYGKLKNGKNSIGPFRGRKIHSLTLPKQIRIT